MLFLLVSVRSYNTFSRKAKPPPAKGLLEKDRRKRKIKAHADIDEEWVPDSTGKNPKPLRRKRKHACKCKFTLYFLMVLFILFF